MSRIVSAKPRRKAAERSSEQSRRPSPVSNSKPENPQNEMTFSVLRYQLFVGGREYCCIDKLNHILRIQGKDFYSKINPLI